MDRWSLWSVYPALRRYVWVNTTLTLQADGGGILPPLKLGKTSGLRGRRSKWKHYQDMYRSDVLIRDIVPHKCTQSPRLIYYHLNRNVLCLLLKLVKVQLQYGITPVFTHLSCCTCPARLRTKRAWHFMNFTGRAKHWCHISTWLCERINITDLLNSNLHHSFKIYCI